MLTLYANGCVIGCPPSKPNKNPVKRGLTTGWSDTATRNNTKFLYSVDTESLPENGFAFTLTLRDLPETPQEFARMRDAWLKRCRRIGLIAYHWCLEWQRRGVPHLHGCLFFVDSITQNDMRSLISAWCEISADYGSKYHAQDFKPIQDRLGWLQYLAKHTARGKHHYQRSNRPPEWACTGRVWGKGGDWATLEVTADVPMQVFHQFRRFLRNWRKADARSKLPVEYGDTTLTPGSKLYRYLLPHGYVNKKRIVSARKMLKCSHVAKSKVRGCSEWISYQFASTMLKTAHEVAYAKYQTTSYI